MSKSTHLVSSVDSTPAVDPTTATDGVFLATLGLHASVKVIGVAVVTRPVLKQQDDVPYAVTILSPIVESNMLNRVARDGTPQMKPAAVCNVLNLQTGEEQTLICNAMLQSTLQTAYVDDSYVGKSFAFISRKIARPDGKNLRQYAVKELVLDA